MLLDTSRPFSLNSVMISHHRFRVIVRQNNRRIYVHSDQHEPELEFSLAQLTPLLADRLRWSRALSKRIVLCGLAVTEWNSPKMTLVLHAQLSTVLGPFQIKTPRLLLRRHFNAVEQKKIMDTIQHFNAWLMAYCDQQQSPATTMTQLQRLEQQFLSELPV